MSGGYFIYLNLKIISYNYVWKLFHLLTSGGPVLSSDHSGADSLICNLGSSQETAKYIDTDIV